MRRAILLLAPLLAAGIACEKGAGPPRSSIAAIDCRTREVPAGTVELAVFDGQVSLFLGRRLHVVDGDLRWGAESFGRVKKGDKLAFTDDGWSVNGEHRQALGIKLEVHVNGSTVKLDLMEQTARSSETGNAIGGLRWHYFDETLHVNDRAYGPIRPGDTIRLDEGEVLVNGKPALPMY